MCSCWFNILPVCTSLLVALNIGNCQILHSPAVATHIKFNTREVQNVISINKERYGSTSNQTGFLYKISSRCSLPLTHKVIGRIFNLISRGNICLSVKVLIMELYCKVAVRTRITYLTCIKCNKILGWHYRRLCYQSTVRSKLRHLNLSGRTGRYLSAFALSGRIILYRWSFKNIFNICSAESNSVTVYSVTDIRHTTTLIEWYTCKIYPVIPGIWQIRGHSARIALAFNIITKSISGCITYCQNRSSDKLAEFRKNSLESYGLTTLCETKYCTIRYSPEYLPIRTPAMCIKILYLKGHILNYSLIILNGFGGRIHEGFNTAFIYICKIKSEGIKLILTWIISCRRVLLIKVVYNLEFLSAMFSTNSEDFILTAAGKSLFHSHGSLGNKSTLKIKEGLSADHAILFVALILINLIKSKSTTVPCSALKVYIYTLKSIYRCFCLECIILYCPGLKRLIARICSSIV